MLILGTSSQWRKKVFDRLAIPYKSMSPDIDEKAIRIPHAADLALAIARAKAQALLPQLKPDDVLITCDQVVVCESEILEKPNNSTELRKFFNMYNRTGFAATISAVVATTINGQFSGVDKAIVRFNTINKFAADTLVRDNNLYTSAGGFLTEYDPFRRYVESVEGDFGSIEGLPIPLTFQLLSQVSDIEFKPKFELNA